MFANILVPINRGAQPVARMANSSDRGGDPAACQPVPPASYPNAEMRLMMTQAQGPPYASFNHSLSLGREKAIRISTHPCARPRLVFLSAQDIADFPS